MKKTAWHDMKYFVIKDLGNSVTIQVSMRRQTER